MARRQPGRHRALLTVIAAALLLALAPTRWTRWVGWFQDPVAFLFTPISHPLMKMSRTLRPARGADSPDDPRLRELEVQTDQLRLRLRRKERRIAELERTIEQLQGGLAVTPRTPVRVLAAPVDVTARSSDLADRTLRVAAGRSRGVAPGRTVAVARGVHLVGRVVDVGARSCWVLPVTSPKAGWIEAIVITGDSLESSWACQIRADGQGALVGDVEAEASGVERGQLVRLDDETWPSGAQMLSLGRVEEVTTKENGRLQITVRPEIDVDRVGQVVLRITEASDPAGSPERNEGPPGEGGGS